MVSGVAGAQGLRMVRLVGGGGDVKTSANGRPEQESPLLALVERNDPEAAKALRESAEDARRVIETLRQQAESGRKSMSEIRKAAAREKMMRIQQELAALKMMGGGDAKAVARRIARLSRELAAAVRDYVAAGGQAAMGTGMPAGGGAAVSAGEAGGSAKPASEPAAPVPPEPGPVSEAPPEGVAAPSAPASEKETTADSPHQRRSIGDSDNFLLLAKRLKEALKEALRDVRRRMQSEGAAGRADRQQAEQALREAEQALASLGVAVAPGTGLDVLV